VRDLDDDLDPTLAALYDKERAAPLPVGASARILAGIAGLASAGVADAAVAAKAGTVAAGAGATGVSTGAVVAIAVASAIGGGAIGVVGYRQIAEPTPVRAPAPVPEPMPAPTPQPAPEPRRPDLDASVALPADAPVARPPRRDAAPVEPDLDTREPLLVDRARAALRRGLLEEALTTLMQHERIHPHGALAEERDVLIVEAYVAKGEVELAKRRIERYRRDHPRGFLRSRVDAAEATLDR
jgi:hypothetical protein